MKKKLKLFVWTHYCPDYTNGLAFAIAENVEDARKSVEDARGRSVDDWGTLSIHDLDTPVTFQVTGGG